MNWIKRITILSVWLGLTACGVKGDPLPPEKPETLGRGRPTYRRAGEEIKIEKGTQGSTPDTKADEENDEE